MRIGKLDSELLTVEEVAALLRVPKSWVYERCLQTAAHPLPHIKLGKYVRFRKQDILEYLEGQGCRSANPG